MKPQSATSLIFTAYTADYHSYRQIATKVHSHVNSLWAEPADSRHANPSFGKTRLRFRDRAPASTQAYCPKLRGCRISLVESGHRPHCWCFSLVTLLLVILWRLEPRVAGLWLNSARRELHGSSPATQRSNSRSSISWLFPIPKAPASRRWSAILPIRQCARAALDGADKVILLAAILGGAAEADYALARRVNVDATLGLFEFLRERAPGPDSSSPRRLPSIPSRCLIPSTTPRLWDRPWSTARRS